MPRDNAARALANKVKRELDKEAIDIITGLQTQISALTSRVSAIEPSGWYTPTLLNGFEPYTTTYTPKYKIIGNGLLILSGGIKHNSGTMPLSTTILTLPKSPIHPQYYICTNANGTGQSVLMVDTTGDFKIYTTTNQATLNINVSFTIAYAIA